MEDVVSFPTDHRSSCTISPYRAYRFAPDGSVRATILMAERELKAERRAALERDAASDNRAKAYEALTT
jgi:hypothetical protein